MPNQPQEQEKDAGGRPTKLTGEFLAAMMNAIYDDQNALFYSDEDLIFLINDKLPPKARIHGDTFSLWKNGKISDNVRGQKFFSVYRRALLRQKMNLFRKLDDPQNPRWQKEAWGIERKFGDWNIKRQVSVTKTEDGAAALAAVRLWGDDAPDAVPSGPIQTAAGKRRYEGR